MSTPVLQLIEARVAAEADQAIDVGYVMRSTSITVDGLRYKRCLAKQRYGVTDVRFEADGSKIKSILASFKQDSSGNLQRYHINARIGHSVVSATFETDKLLRSEFIKRCTDLVQAAKRKGNEANARVAREPHTTIEDLYDILPDPFVIPGWSLYCGTRLVSRGKDKIIEIYDADHPRVITFRILEHDGSIKVIYYACRGNERFTRSLEASIKQTRIELHDLHKVMIELMEKFNSAECDRMFGRA